MNKSKKQFKPEEKKNKFVGKKTGRNSSWKSKSSKISDQRKQPTADSSEKRVNYDNTRVTKFERDMAREGANDFQWYNRNPELLESAANISIGYPAGTPLYPFDEETALNGVYVARYIPTFGPFDNLTVNQAAQSMFSFVNRANSRIPKYDASDMYMMIHGGIEIYAALGHCMRAYGIVKHFKMNNLNSPVALLKAMGFNYQDLADNLGQVWFDINQLIVQTKLFTIPKDIPLMKRRFWMNTNVFKDSPTDKAAYYMYVPYKFRYYAETASNGGGCLLDVPKPISIANDNMSVSAGETTPFNTQVTYDWSDWKRIIQFMINVLVNSTDRGIIMADLEKAYGAENMVYLEELPASFQIEPLYNAEVQLQFENLNVVRELPILGYVQKLDRIYPLINTKLASSWSNGNLKNNAWYYVCVPNHRVLNFHQPNVTKEMVTEATRLMVAGMTQVACVQTTAATEFYSTKYKSDSAHPYPYLDIAGSTSAQDPMPTISVPLPLAVGTEVIVMLQAYYMKKPWGTVAGRLIGATSMTSYAVSDVQDEMARSWAILCEMDWAPFMYGVTPDYTNSTQNQEVKFFNNLWYKSSAKPLGEYDNYTVVDESILLKLHQACLFSLLGQPMF